MNNMEKKFQRRGMEVVEIVAKMWAAIPYRRASMEKSNSGEEERFMCTVRVVVGKGEIYC